MRIDMSKVLIGLDFEMLIRNKDNKFISAIPYIEGTKDQPLPVSGNGHMIQHDGVLFEANTPPVTVNDKEKMWEDIQYVLEQGKQRLPEALDIVCCSNGAFEDDQLTDPIAKLAGCDPDFSAWEGGDSNQKPDLSDNPNRCCGLHFHISYPGATPKNAMKLIRLLDVYLAIPMLFVDEDRQRRKLYGKAGCFRFKDYGTSAGVEYRTLSNAVITSKDVFMFCFDQLIKALEAFNQGVDFLKYGDDIQEAVNNYNINLAEKICEELSILMPLLESA